MIVVTKNNIARLSESVEYLIKLGFKKLNLLFDYLADWQDEDLKVIKEQFTSVSQIYSEKLLDEEDVDFYIFDEKIKTHINDEINCNDDCQIGMKAINVGADGNFYPCMQFVDNKEYIIGNCEEGINFEARKRILEDSKIENEICKECDLRKRCKHVCPCKNYMTTKSINGLSPLVCEFERIIIEIADEMAENLYKKGSKLFIQKFYNENYGIIKEIMKKQEKGM